MNMCSGQHEVAASGPRQSLRITWILAGASLAGGVRANHDLANAMAQRGHHVTIVYPEGALKWPKPWQVRQFFYRLRKEFQVARRQRHHLVGGDVVLRPIPRATVQAEDVPDSDVCITSWWAMREAVEDWPPEKGARVYLIRHHELHGGDESRVRATYQLPGLKVVVSRWLQRVMEQEYDDASAVLVPDAVDHDLFSAPPRDREEPPTVGFMYGRQPWKGTETALEAVRLLQQVRPNVRVVSFGSAPMNASWARPANFQFHLRPPQHELAALYRQADCWLMPSWAEGFGLPGLEAAACRCPVISTRCGGPEDYVIDGESGYLVDVKDAAGMARAIQRVLDMDSHAWRRMSETSHQIAGGFNWNRSAEKLEQALLAHLSTANRH